MTKREIMAVPMVFPERPGVRLWAACRWKKIALPNSTLALLPAKPPLSAEEAYDVLVVGGGLLYAAAACMPLAEHSLA